MAFDDTARARPERNSRSSRTASSAITRWRSPSAGHRPRQIQWLRLLRQRHAFPIQPYAKHLASAEPQPCSLNDLIGGVERGIYISGAGSWSIDQQRDNFQFTGSFSTKSERQAGSYAARCGLSGAHGRVLEFARWAWRCSTYHLGGAFNCGKASPCRSHLCRMGPCKPVSRRDRAEHRARGCVSDDPHCRRSQSHRRASPAFRAREGCIVHVTGGQSLNLRFARNSANLERRAQHGQRQHHLAIRPAVWFGDREQPGGGRAGSSATPLRGDRPARAGDPEQLPPLEPQSYAVGAAFDPATAARARGPVGGFGRHGHRRGPARGRGPAGYATAEARSTPSQPAPGLRPMTATAWPNSPPPRAARTVAGPAGRRFRSSFRRPRRCADRRSRGREAAYSQIPMDLDPPIHRHFGAFAAGELLHYLMWSMDARSCR